MKSPCFHLIFLQITTKNAIFVQGTVLRGEKKGPSAAPWLRLPSSFPCHGDRAARAPDVNMAVAAGRGGRGGNGLGDGAAQKPSPAAELADFEVDNLGTKKLLVCGLIYG